MTGETAQVGINAWFSGRLEAEEFSLTLFEHPGMENDFLGLRNELAALGGFGILGHLIGGQSHFLKGTGLDQNQIMRSDVRVV